VIGTTLVLTQQIADELAAMANEADEIAAVLLVGTANQDGHLRLLSRELHRVPDRHCERAPDGMQVTSAGWVPAVARAAAIGATPVWIHTHPGGTPLPSRHDRIVDAELHEPFSIRSGSAIYASVIVSPSRNGTVTFSGVVSSGGRRLSVDRLVVVGPRIHLTGAYDASTPESIPASFDRQIRAFGGDVQRTLAGLTIGVVGAGGTGSAVLEQLARLGAQDLLVVDPDTLSLANTTRVYGSAPDQVGMPKVDVAKEHLARIAPTASIRTCQGTINNETVARLLGGCDVVFGCTDDDAGRMVLSRISTYMLVPVFDCGVLIDSVEETINGIHARVTIMGPGYACLLCRRRIDPVRASAELRVPAEQARLLREGYAPELGFVEPAVVAYTSLVAALAVGEFLERLIGYGPDNTPSELLFRIHERAVSTNTVFPLAGHYCDPAAGQAGTGDVTPYLGQTWPS